MSDNAYYYRFKKALGEIAECETIEEARGIAREALRSRAKIAKPPVLPMVPRMATERIDPRACVQCGERRRGFPESPQSKFCGLECREAYAVLRFTLRISTREAQVLAMRESGMTYTEIGRVLGICNAAAGDIGRRGATRRHYREVLTAHA